MINLPDYVIERLRQEPPPNASVIECATPVLGFGDPTKARIATLGLNPSRIEFLDKSGKEYNAEQRRLETLTSVKVKSLKDAQVPVLEAVAEGCNSYFRRRPYRRWFDQLEIILSACGASYYDGSACHLDLVQWATDPTWRKLRVVTRTTLLRQDVPFLLNQLQNENIQVLLLNGRSVVREFSVASGIQLAEHPEKVGNARMFEGRGPKDILIVGWSTNLQSSYGVTNEFRKCLGQRVASVVGRIIQT